MQDSETVAPGTVEDRCSIRSPGAGERDGRENDVAGAMAGD